MVLCRQTETYTLSHSLKVNISSFSAGGWVPHSLSCNLPPLDNIQLRCIWEATPICSVIHQFHNLSTSPLQQPLLPPFLPLSPLTLILPMPCLWHSPALTMCVCQTGAFSVFQDARVSCIKVLLLLEFQITWAAMIQCFYCEHAKYIREFWLVWYYNRHSKGRHTVC